MQVALVGIEEIHPYEQNPRDNDGAVEAVAHSIGEFGFRQPIVVDGEGVIVCGHTRWKAAKALGLEKVPVHVASDLSPEQARAYRIADNQTSSLSSWDDELLSLELSALSDLDFDLDLLGFDQHQLDQLLHHIGSVDEGEDEEIPEPPEDAISEAGALYELGRHRLLVGDATSTEDVEHLLGGEKSSMLLIDPPYNVAYVGGTAESLTIQNDSMPLKEYKDFLTQAFRAAALVMLEGAPFYIWHADSFGGLVRNACESVGLQIRQCLIWVKSSLVLGRQDYQWRHEPCLYGWKSGAGHHWFGDRKQTTVLEYPTPTRNGDHPTMKPVELFEQLVCNSAAQGELVLDVFSGSGTTVLACEKTGRTARAMELDPRYADVIRRRWATAVHGEEADWQALTPRLS